MLHSILSFLDSFYLNNMDSPTMNKIALIYFNEKSFQKILIVKQMNDQKGKKHLFFLRIVALENIISIETKFYLCINKQKGLKEKIFSAICNFEPLHW